MIAGQNPHKGGLPGSVGSEKSDDLLRRYLEGDAPHRLEGAVTLGYLPHLYHALSSG